jgi:hypothetical protein
MSIPQARAALTRPSCSTKHPVREYVTDRRFLQPRAAKAQQYDDYAKSKPVAERAFFRQADPRARTSAGAALEVKFKWRLCPRSRKRPPRRMRLRTTPSERDVPLLYSTGPTATLWIGHYRSAGLEQSWNCSSTGRRSSGAWRNAPWRTMRRGAEGHSMN